MTPTEMRNERLAQRLMKNLARRHYESYYCKTAADIVGKVRELIPEGSSVTWGGSMSIRDTGVTRMLKEGNYQVFGSYGNQTKYNSRCKKCYTEYNKCHF